MPTPRYLSGVALLFWGAMTGHVVPGVACALLVESAHWTKVRWDFGERAFLYAWRASVLLLLVTMVLVLLNGARLHAMSIVFTWLPVILVPLQFVQTYGKSSTTTLATFSMMVRRRREHALRHGLPFREVRFGFGNVYLCATLLSACLGSKTGTPLFFPLLILLSAWGLATAGGISWRRIGLPATVCAVVLASGLGIGGHAGLMALYRHVTNSRYHSNPQDDSWSSREHRTSMGSMGELKQSPKIRWRLSRENGPLPQRLRIASYSTYYSGTWRANLLPMGTTNEDDGFAAIAEITNPQNPGDAEDKFYIAAQNLIDLKLAASPSLHRFRLRGGTDPQDYTLLPLPADIASFHRFNPMELDANPHGTIRHKPAQPIVDARILWHPEFLVEQPPWKSTVIGRGRHFASNGGNGVGARDEITVEPDLQIPPSEAAIITRVASELGLHGLPLQEKIDQLRQHFLTNFQYSRYSTHRSLARGFDPEVHGTLLGKFLEHSRLGHCEFYATASALLLRETGVPTRFVTGFVVAERDQRTGEALIRGIHGHAWARAWDAAGETWIDVDLTPPDWLGREAARKERFQALTDWFQLWREDMLIWRDQPGRIQWITLSLMLPLVLGTAWIGRRLWRSRGRLETDPARRVVAGVTVTPLAALEKPARKVLGERPPGMPLTSWLRQLAPRLESPGRLAEALAIHQTLRFDPREHDPDLVERLGRLAESLRREITKR